MYQKAQNYEHIKVLYGFFMGVRCTDIHWYNFRYPGRPNGGCYIKKNSFIGGRVLPDRILGTIQWKIIL